MTKQYPGTGENILNLPSNWKVSKFYKTAKKEAGGVWEKNWSHSTLFAIQVLLDNSSVLCTKHFWGKSIHLQQISKNYSPFRPFQAVFADTPGYTEQTPHVCGYTRCSLANTIWNDTFTVNELSYVFCDDHKIWYLIMFWFLKQYLCSLDMRTFRLLSCSLYQ